MDSTYILELTLPNSYNIFIGVEASDEESAKSAAGHIIEALQPTEIQVHPGSWVLNHTIPQPAIWIYIAQQKE